MRVLLCQTPRLTYVQAIELLQRETFGLPVDLALFPEMAIEHPPQCTGQGDLTFENVAFLMLSRFAKQRNMYIVLGSVEERTDDTRMYDTCVVLNRIGEMIMFYRKQSTVLLGKAAGVEPGIFETEFGPIGLMLGTEIEEEQRWAELLAMKPYLILNPARAPVQMDPVLIHTHPELQVAAWHQGLRRLEHIVETRTRQYPCSFVRADAPFQEGGAGTSLLVEPHRSFLAPRWSSAFFVVDTLHPYELEGRKLPGWRQLTIDERARLAARDRALLTQEEIERGPRYLVWTLRPSGVGGIRLQHSAQWSTNKRKILMQQVDSLAGDGAAQVAKRQAFLVLNTAKDNRPIYSSITSRGVMLQWDIRLKREVRNTALGSTSITAAGPWRFPNQLIVVSSTRNQVSLRIFEDSVPIEGLSFNMQDEVKLHRKSTAGARRRSSVSKEKTKEDGENAGLDRMDRLDAKRMPMVSALHHVHGKVAILIFDPVDSESEPTARMVDFDEGEVESVDIYGIGPPSIIDSDDEEETVKPKIIDKIVSTQMIEQQFRGRQQRLLAVLYESNRLCLLTVNDSVLHEQMLLEEGATERQRNDSPLAFVALPSQTADSFNMIVSYQSMMLRWWQVSLSQSKLQAHTTVTAAITHLAILDWPTTPAGGQAPAIDKHDKFLPGLQASAPAAPRKIPHAPKSTLVNSVRLSLAPPIVERTTSGRCASSDKVSARASLFKKKEHLPEASLSGSLPRPVDGRPSVKVVADEFDGRASANPPTTIRASLAASARRHSTASNGARTRASIRRHSGANSSESDRAADTHGGDDTFSPKDPGCLLIVAFDLMGGMPLFMGRNGRIVKVYTCSDHFVDKSAKVEQLLCDGRSVAVQLSNADIRHFEFVLEEDVINLTDVPMEQSA